jgi:hypothetical protein
VGPAVSKNIRRCSKPHMLKYFQLLLFCASELVLSYHDGLARDLFPTSEDRD